MPKFHLNDYHIELDNATYDESESYTKVSIFSFSNKYGTAKLKGFFDLTNKNIPTLITLNKLSFEISRQLLNTSNYNFCNYKLELDFIFSDDDIYLIKNKEKDLMKEYNCSIDYNNKKIHISLNEIKNINLLNLIRGNIERNEDTTNNYNSLIGTRNKIKNIDEDKIFLNKLQFEKINMNNENIQNQQIIDNLIEDDTLNNIEMDDISKLENPFISNISEKTEEKKIYTMSEDNIYDGLNSFKKNYIKYTDIKKINNLVNNNYKENYINKIENPKIKNEVEKLISNGALYMKKNLKTNILSSININGLYCLLKNNKNNNNYKFLIKKLSLNNDIDNKEEEISDYKKIIFHNYINLLDKTANNKKSNNLNINEYTSVIIAYLSLIQSKIDEVEKRENKSMINNKIIERYKKIISTLKLFCILFLNCFMYKPENEYINDPDLFTNSFSDKVKAYRKRLLIEWCIDEQNKNLEKNLSKLNINAQKNIKSNYEKLYSFGQIKKNVDNKNNKKISLFMRARMSNNNEKIAKNNMYYFTGYNIVHGENNRNFRDIFVDKYNNDWLSFLVQSLLYEEKKDQYIINSIELLSKHISNMNKKAKPIIINNNNGNNNSQIYDVHFILLKLYEMYMKGEINEQIKYLKMFSHSCNISSNYASEHFIQYIICSILLKILPILFPKDKEINREIIDNAFIKKITYNLLIQSIEELFIKSPDINNMDNYMLKYENYIEGIKLITLSFLNKKTKNKLINDILSKLNISSDSLKYIEENNPLLLTDKQNYTLLGYTNISLCLWKNAYNCFISAKEYKYALDTCINYAVEHIKENNENSDFHEIYLRLQEIIKNEPELFIDIYQILFLFIKYINEHKKNNLGTNEICELLKEFSAKDKYLCCDLIDDEVRGIIIDLLYKLLIKINGIDIATGNCELISEKYVKMSTELNIMNNSFWDNVELKNKIFH